MNSMKKKFILILLLPFLFSVSTCKDSEDTPVTDAAVPKILTHPAGGKYALNALLSLSITVYPGGGGDLSCQWYKNTVDDTSGTIIEGATLPAYTATLTEIGTFYYYAVVTNTDTRVNGIKVQSVASNTAMVEVISPTEALEELEIDTFMNYYYHEIALPSETPSGLAINWTSDSADYPVTSNRVKTRDNVDGDFTFKLTAASAKEFTVTAKEKNFFGYLLVYFSGNSVSDEQVRYALSTDGFNFTTLNNNKPVMLSPDISSAGGVRDPYILRGADGAFYMTLTDMRSSLGWASNRGIILLKSDDLINWTHSQVNVSAKWPANFGDINSAWAPEVVYDRKTGKYMVFFSCYRNGTPHRIYYSYANGDFTDLTDEPVQLYYHPNNASAIDGNIINFNGKFYMFYKNEENGLPNSKHIAMARSDTLNGGYDLIFDNVDKEGSGSANEAEGCQVYRLFGSETFVLMYDRYNQNPAQFRFNTSTNPDSDNWTRVNTASTNFTPRHGHVIPITQEEYNRLQSYTGWPGIVQPPEVTEDAELKLHYSFDSGGGDTTASGGIQNRAGSGHAGTITGTGGSLAVTNGMPNFYTGTNTGTANSGTPPAYVDMGSSASSIITGQEDFTVAAYVNISADTSLGGDGWFLWTFAAAQNVADSSPCTWFRARDTQYTISRNGWSGESYIRTGSMLPRGRWVHVMYRQKGNLGTIYIDGVPAETGTTAHKTTDLGTLSYNWIGRPCYSADNFMTGTRYADFRIYSGAISESQIAALDITAKLTTLNN